jgi:peroxiredoxin
MKHVRWMLLLALPLSVGIVVWTRMATQGASQERLKQQVQDLQNEVATLIKDENFAQASVKLEELQMLFVKAGRYQEALEASLQIEQVDGKASGRRSPWNYVRIAEAYLWLGDREKFFDWIEKAISERSFTKLDYFQSAQLDGVRDHPRFKKLVAACATLIGVGREAKDFHVTLLDGSSFSLVAQRGKVVLLDFWDVRCGPCRKEMPNLKRIFKDFKDKGLEIVGISLDTERALLEDYLKEAALPWKIACSWDGWDDQTAQLYRISATPSTWVIDRHGIVRYFDVRGEELRRAVEALIRET